MRRDPLTRRIARWRRATRLLLIAEALWPIVWPPLGLIGLYLCLALLDLPQRLGDEANTLILLADLAAAAIWLAAGLRRLRFPDDAAIRRHLQRASGLTHDPIAALEDTPAQTDDFALALWEVHRARSLAALSKLRLGVPKPGLDRFALRGGLVVALVACAVVAGPARWARLDRAFTFDFAFIGSGAPPPAVTAWITPPAYTGRAPTLLRADQPAATVPAGSRLTVTVAGVSRAPRLTGVTRAFAPLDATSFQLDTRLTQSGLLTLRGGGARLARWQVSVVADQPPTIAFTAPPGPDGGSASLRLPWRAADDYGVVSAMMEAHLQAHPTAAALTEPLTLPDGAGTVLQGVQIADLAANPWAGLPVAMRLTARDALGQQGATPVVTVTLPERQFTDAVARRVIAIRKYLVLAPNPQSPAARDDAAHAVFETGAEAIQAGKPATSVLPLLATGWLLVDDGQPTAVAEAVDRLWQVALHFEQGDAADTAQSLRAAQNALQQALQSKSATPQELTQLMRAVQAAVLQHLSMLMQMAQHQNGAIGAQPGGPPLDLSSLAQQMRQMEAAAKAGDMQAMRDSLAALEKSLQALEQARVVQPDPAQQAARQQAMKDMATLQDMLKQQAALMDRSTRRIDAQAPDPSGQRHDAATQEALRSALRGLSPRLGATLDGTGTAMGQAVHQLDQGQDAPAAAAQQQAVTALQQAAKQLGERLARRSGQSGSLTIGSGQGNGRPGDLPGDGLLPGGDNTDPFGRPLSPGEGASLGADVAVPDGSPEARLRAILRDLRHRAGDRTRPQPELDYIDRLLQPF